MHEGMKTVVVTSQKGGSGKTTLARNLAVAAGSGTVLVDTDPQGSLTDWWNTREADEPALAAQSGTITETLQRLRDGGAKLAIVDTAPSTHGFVQELVRLADFVLVPVRPTPDDLRAVGATLDIIEAAKVPFAFVIMQAKPRTRLAADALPVLAQHGRVAPAVIYGRVEYPNAAIDGLG